jgi:type IV secretory pathway TraG/TraD family ATPase VirD4
MRRTWPNFALAVILLLGGVTLAASGVRGVIRDIITAGPAQRLFAPSVNPADAAWWPRTCLSVPQCRVEIAARVAVSLTERARLLAYAMLMLVVAAAWLGMLGLRLRVPPQPAGAARFASRAEMRRLTRRSPGAWFPLGYARRWPAIVRLRPAAAFVSPLLTAWAQPVRLPKEDLARHVLITGLTGAHKTTSVTLPVMLEAARAGVSVVGFDLKYGERDSLAAAAPEWWRRGRPVLAFAPLDGASLRWNPLAACKSFGDAHEFATQLFPDETAGGPDGAYWTGAERGVCASLTWALGLDDGGRSLARLRALAEAGPDAVSAYVRGHPRSGEIAAHLGTYSAMLPKDRAGILQGIAARLDALSDLHVARATGPPAGASGAWDEIVLGRLRREPTLLLVGVPQTALPRLRSLAHILMRALEAEMLRPRGRDETVPVIYLLEELPAWGALPGLADHLATFRSRGVAIVATVQSEAQGQAVYGTVGWAAIAANFVTKIYFPSLADPDADRLSRALGVTAVERLSRSRGWTSRGRHEGEQRLPVEIPLRRPEALQGIGAPEHEIILRSPGLPPARLWCPPFHERPEQAHLVRDTVPSTFEIAVRRRVAGVGRTDPAAATKPPAATPAQGPESASRPFWPAAPAGSSGSPNRAIAPPPSAPAGVQRGVPAGACDDARILSAFVRAALDQCTGTKGSKIGIIARVVRRGEHLAEVRLDPAAAYRLLGGGEAAQSVVRRWAERRWVKQVRPAFVLERCALEALDADLQRRLVGQAPSPRPGPRGR